MTQQEILNQFGSLEKLITDTNFRKALKNDPRKALAQELSGVQIPDNVNLIVHENTANEMHVILLPDTEASADDIVDDDPFEAVLDKAMLDKSFKDLLMIDPKGVLAKELPDFYVPDEFKVYFHENTATEWHLLIPSLETEDEDGELSEDELEAVAGGAGRRRRRRRRRGPHIGRRRGGKGPRCRKKRFR